jgi:hypothetical protein
LKVLVDSNEPNILIYSLSKNSEYHQNYEKLESSRLQSLQSYFRKLYAYAYRKIYKEIDGRKKERFGEKGNEKVNIFCYKTIDPIHIYMN